MGVLTENLLKKKVLTEVSSTKTLTPSHSGTLEFIYLVLRICVSQHPDLASGRAVCFAATRAEILLFSPNSFNVPTFKLSNVPTIPRSIPFVFKILRTLLHVFALVQDSTLLFSSDSALFAKNRGWVGSRLYLLMSSFASNRFRSGSRKGLVCSGAPLIACVSSFVAPGKSPLFESMRASAR